MKTLKLTPSVLARLSRHLAATVLVTGIFAASALQVERDVKAGPRLAAAGTPAALSDAP